MYGLSTTKLFVCGNAFPDTNIFHCNSCKAENQEINKPQKILSGFLNISLSFSGTKEYFFVIAFFHLAW